MYVAAVSREHHNLSQFLVSDQLVQIRSPGTIRQREIFMSYFLVLPSKATLEKHRDKFRSPNGTGQILFTKKQFF